MCNITMYKYTDWIGLPYFSGCTHRFSVQKWEDPLGELGVAPVPRCPNSDSVGHGADWWIQIHWNVRKKGAMKRHILCEASKNGG